jgi:hypothetical protein
VDQTDAQGCFEALFGVAMVGLVAVLVVIALVA